MFMPENATNMTFESAAARDIYLPHPDHLAVVPLVHAVAEQVLVFDLERHSTNA